MWRSKFWRPQRLRRPTEPCWSPYNYGTPELTPESHPRKALQHQKKPSEENIEAAHISSIENLIHRCSEPGALQAGRRIHRELALRDKLDDRYLQNLLVQMYGKCGSLQDARSVFDSIAEKNVFSWNIMIGACVQNGLHSEACELYKRMDVTPTAVTFVSVLEACFHLGCLVEVDAIHQRTLKLNLNTNPVLATSLIKTFSRCGSIVSAKEVFENVPEKDAVCWTSMITAYARCGHSRGALRTFRRMNLEGILPDFFTITSVVSACGDLRSFQDGHRLYKNVVRFLPCFYDDEVAAALINMYARCGSLVEAFKVFDRTYKDDVLLWNSMITACVEHGENEKALKLYKEGMRKEFGMQPDAVTFILLLQACTNIKDLKQGTIIHREIVAERLDKDPVVVNSLVNMYGKCGELQHARKVFEMTGDRRRVVSWNGMMALYVQQELGNEALKLYEMMSVPPDELTYVTVLAAIGLVGDLKKGRETHEKIIKGGFDCAPVVMNSLLSMYSSCGSLANAGDVFRKMSRRDVVCFNTMISAHMKNGKPNEALRFYPLMDLEGVQPDDITFVELFSVCSHAGLVDRAWGIFLCMVNECGIQPSEKHFGTIVDLLGQAGRLEEAETFLREMKPEPSRVIWMTLLAACKSHGSVELGEKAAEQAMMLDPSDPGPYVSLASIYSGAGMIHEAESLKHRLKDLEESLQGAA